jgi:prophage regulatory protein
MNHQLKFLRLKDVISLTGISKSTIYLLMSKKSFPPHYQLGRRSVGWKQSDIEHWMSSRRELKSSVSGPKK